MLCLSVPQSLLAQSRSVNQLRLWVLLATAEGRIETLNKSLVEPGLAAEHYCSRPVRFR